MKTIFTCLFISVALFVSAQQNTFKVSAFAPQYGYLNQMVQLNDGSLVGVGDNFYEDILDTGSLIKMDASGNVLAVKRVETTEDIQTIVKTSDGGFAVCGNTGGRPQLIKFTANLTIQWEKYYAANGNIRINRMIQTPDGGFLMAGTYYDYKGNPPSAYAIRTDASGDFQFAKQYSGYAKAAGADVSLTDVVATTDGNFAFVSEAFHNSDGTPPDSVYLLKINPAGSVLWSLAAFSKVDGQGVTPNGLIASTDGGLVIAADVYTASTGIIQAAIMKYGNAGNLLWSKRMVTNDSVNTDIYANGVVQDRDGGYLFYGAQDTYTLIENDSDSYYDDTAYMYVAKTSSAGVLQWTKKFYPTDASSAYTEIYNLIPTFDGGYAACGDGAFYYPGIGDYSESGFIFKFNENFGICTDSVVSDGYLQNGIFSVDVTSVDTDIVALPVNLSDDLSDGGGAQSICNSILPIQLLSFTAALQNKSVAVNWTTANEINTDYFVVERSAHGASFSALQKVTAKGNSSLTQSYSTIDLQPLPGTSYYRLKEVDKDGKTTYSSVVPVTVMSNGAIVISPNPVQSMMHVVVQSTANSHLTLQVLDIRGNLLATQTKAVSTGRNEIDIPAASLAKGVYILKVMNTHSMQTVRFMKE